MSRKLVSVFTAIAISAAVIAPASAQTVTQSARVSYADLDLSRSEGVKTLTYRLRTAVDQVCGRAGGSASLTINRHIKTCRDEAMTRAVASMNSVLLAGSQTTDESFQIAVR